MAWAKRQYSKSEVDAAGDVLVDPPLLVDKFEQALKIINNWRACHSFPLNTFQVGLREKASRVDSNYIVAQRIKRLSSIKLKLGRFKTMKLSQMQDIGGCRAVVHSIQQVHQLVDLYKKSRIKHKLDHIDDYIQKPQRSGYRGVHLIYRYFSDKSENYNGFKIEVQLRSPLQHAWATAVETVGTFINQALKSSQGEAEWLRFFALMGTAIANKEKTSIVPDTPNNKKDLVAEIRSYAEKLDVASRLKAYGATLKTLEDPGAKDAHYFLLSLDPAANQVTVTGYRANELERASQEYLAVERAISEKPGAEAVLVSVESLATLKRAYPNYFLDTGVFIDAVNKVLSP